LFTRDIIRFVKIDTDSPGHGADYAGGEGNGEWPARLAPVLDIARPAVGFVLSSTGYAVARRFRETLAPLELEPREFALLRAVGAAEGQTQQAIGERLGIPASRMVAFVDALEARKLLERRANPIDRRARALHLTSAGSKLLNRAFVAASGLEQHLCATLSTAERAQLLELLGRVARQLGLASGASSTHAHAALADE
jgi:DNA-binding MarR family transcriptional regulator